ncbi:MAG: agmatine deiminase, partial [Proteobacteria bacterium SW_6_67_9]
RALAQGAELRAPHTNVATILIETDDTWARDIAPITTLADGLPLLIDYRFNGWGNKFEHGLDARFGRQLVDTAGFATLGYEPSDFVLEGGAIDTDGEGTLLINRPTVLSERRNPGFNQAAAEAKLRDTLGIERVHWLDLPQLAGDDTDGHIDTLARFGSRDAIVHASPHDEHDPNVGALNQLEQQLAALRTPDGEPYRLVPLPGPEPITGREGALCPASYANFLVLNEAVLVPSFADARDADAIEAIQALFPDRIVVPVPSRTFVGQAGSIHCLTMQLPQGVFEDLAF